MKGKKASFVLFIGNIPSEVKVSELKEIFVKKIPAKFLRLSVPTKVKNDPNFSYTYLTCPNALIQKKAAKLKITIKDSQLKIRKVLEDDEVLCKFDFSNMSKILFLQWIPHNCTNTDLYNFFSSFAKIGSVYCVRPSKHDKSKYFGYVQFENEEDVLLLTNKEIKFGNDYCTCLSLSYVPNFLRSIILKKLEISASASKQEDFFEKIEQRMNEVISEDSNYYGLYKINWENNIRLATTIFKKPPVQEKLKNFFKVVNCDNAFKRKVWSEILNRAYYCDQRHIKSNLGFRPMNELTQELMIQRNQSKLWH